MTQSSGNTPLAGVAALQQMLGKPGVLVVDCRHDLANPAFGSSAYAAAHVPGAIFAHMDADLAAPRRPDSGRHPLPSPAAFAATLGRWGFTESSQVFAYDQGSGAWAARLWWMLRARGHQRVQVLDGGFPAWLAAGGPVTVDPPAVKPTTVAPRDFAGVLDSAEVVEGLRTGAITLVDARAADRFAGRNETVDPVAGHVPGAVSHPFTTNLGAAQQFLPPAALRQSWAHVLDRPGLMPVVAMCGSGITACHNLLALELAGHRGARLYAGSYSEWITDPARPVATGE
jgi:thiosulfate/3-mercaptopyruvate sulfurtransferase